MTDRIFYFILVPMVYLALGTFLVGITSTIVRIFSAPRHASALHTYPRRRAGGLWALQETFTMPQVRRQAPVFWIFLMVYHVAFLLLIIAHLDLLPGIRIMPPDSRHMLGAGSVGVAVTLGLIYFLLRRMRHPTREISVFGDYLLLVMLLFTCFTGDTISWANSWNPDGFVLGKEDFTHYLQILVDFSFENPREVLPGSHYVVVVLHVALANLFLMLFPFTKFMHTFLAMPLNRLRRG